MEFIHEYLTTIGENVREGKIKLDEFIVFKVSLHLLVAKPLLTQAILKRLGKNPEDYPDAKSQPHVQVALRMKARGATPRAGDVIPYVFCLGPGGESGKTAQADRAKHPDEVRKIDSDLQIGKLCKKFRYMPSIHNFCC